MKSTNTRTDTEKNTFCIIDDFYVTSAQLRVIILCFLVKCTETIFFFTSKRSVGNQHLTINVHMLSFECRYN